MVITTGVTEEYAHIFSKYNSNDEKVTYSTNIRTSLLSTIDLHAESNDFSFSTLVIIYLLSGNLYIFVIEFIKCTSSCLDLRKKIYVWIMQYNLH